LYLFISKRKFAPFAAAVQQRVAPNSDSVSDINNGLLRERGRRGASEGKEEKIAAQFFAGNKQSGFESPGKYLYTSI
jgi:hypothetical protein